MGLLDLFKRLAANDSGGGLSSLLDRLKPGYFNEIAKPFASHIDALDAGVRSNPYRDEALKDIYAPQHGQPLGSANTNFTPAQAEIEDIIAAMDRQRPATARASDRWGVDEPEVPGAPDSELGELASAAGDDAFPRDPFLYGEVSPDDLYPQAMDASMEVPDGNDLLQNLLRMQQEGAGRGPRQVTNNPLAPGRPSAAEQGIDPTFLAKSRWGVQDPVVKALLLGLGGAGGAAALSGNRPA